VQKGNTEVMLLLLRRGANPNVRNLVRNLVGFNSSLLMYDR
jgi:hypothetical protein